MNKASQDNMNDKITMSALTALLSVRSGDSKEQVESFLRELFDIIVSELERGDTVKVPGIGAFKTIVVEARKSVNVNTGEEVLIPEHKKVVFLPCKELAATVNAPFQMFQTLELTDEMAAEFDSQSQESDKQELTDRQDLSDEENKRERLHVEEERDEPGASNDVSVSAEEHDYDVAASSDINSSVREFDESELLEQSCDPDNMPANDNALYPENDENLQLSEISKEPEEPEEEEIMEENEPSSGKSRFWPGFFTGFGAAAFCGLLVWGIILILNIKQPDCETQVTNVMPVPAPTKPITADTAASYLSDTISVKNARDTADAAGEDQAGPSVPTQPSDQRKYDTITKTRYLTTMAKDHYGNYHLWPYIYKENEKILGHPDRIKPGTKVVVPDLSKYGVDPKNPEDIAKAKKLGIAIYARYQ